MRDPLTRQRPAGTGRHVAQHITPAQHTAVGPLALLLSRLDRVRKCGRGFIARCPAHDDRSASLSLAEGNDGRALVHCFAGCAAADVVHALGLQLADLYPERLSPLNPQHRQELRQIAQLANWRAALNVLGGEAAVIEIAAGMLATGNALNPEDHDRVLLACDRIHAARGVLQ